MTAAPHDRWAVNPDPLQPGLITTASSIVIGSVVDSSAGLIEIRVERVLKGAAELTLTVDPARARFGDPPPSGVFVLDDSTPPQLLIAADRGELTPTRVEAVLNGGSLRVAEPSGSVIRTAAEIPGVTVVSATLVPDADGLRGRITQLHSVFAGVSHPRVGDEVFVPDGEPWDLGRNPSLVGLVLTWTEAASRWILLCPSFSPDPPTLQALGWAMSE